MENAKLYVGNLDYGLTEQELADHFAQAGTVSSTKIITNPENGRSKGFGFVEMSSADEAKAAIEMFDGQELNGRPLTVNEARPQKPRENRF